MLEDTPTDADFTTGSSAQPDPVDPAPADSSDAPARPRRTRKRAGEGSAEDAAPAAKKTAAKKAAAKRTTAKKATKKADAAGPVGDTAADEPDATADKPAAKKTGSRKAASKKKAEAPADPADGGDLTGDAGDTGEKPKAKRTRKKAAEPAGEVAPDGPAAGEASASVAVPLFQVPEQAGPTRRRRSAKATAAAPQAEPSDTAEADGGGGDSTGADLELEGSDEAATEEGATGRRRRRRGGRRRRKSGEGAESESENGELAAEGDDAEAGRDPGDDEAAEGTSRRRRRRRRAGEDGADANGMDDPAKTVTRVRKGRSAEDEITAVSGSTRLEAKKQRRREGREAGRRRAPIVSEAEFLARRESVERVMVVRQRGDLTQIGVLEDKVLVEHYVARESQTSLIGNVYLGRVQNVLPSMEAAFVDIGKGRNAVLYAGEVNWSALGHPEGQPRKIEAVLSSGQQILVQVTKDPMGHKGARLTSQVSLAGRFLVYVPDGTTSGISRKLPDTERNRLKNLLKEIVPDTAGVIVRTAAEGASEEELTRDVERLKARWEDIEKKAAAKGAGAQLLYGEPDLTLKVVRDLFTEDFTKLVIEGTDAWETVQGYVAHVAPDLEGRLERYQAEEHGGRDVFATYRLDEQIHKGLDRKVWLPSGGSLIIDRTEAMTVVDVNTGKFTGSGGNLEETVTKNNLEAAEEIVRQLRLRDIGGIIVVDFIDMVLESNRDLVLRRLVECLGRDRTRHQVAEVTSLGLVQMTRKRIGTGLLESFSRECEHCHGRGLIIEDAPVEPRRGDDEGGRRGRRRGRGEQQPAAKTTGPPSPKDVAAMAQQHAHPEPDGQPVDDQPQDDQPLDDQPLDDQPLDEQPQDDRHLDQAAMPTDAEPVVEAVEVLPPVDAEQSEAVDGVIAAASGEESLEAPAGDPADESPEVSAEELGEELGEESEEKPGEEPGDDGSGPPADEPGDDEAPPPSPPAPPAPPKVVTRTRRRAATRPAGPPAAAASGGAPATGGVVLVDDSAATGGDDHDHHDAGHDSGPALHVPIKRRGRKR